MNLDCCDPVSIGYWMACSGWEMPADVDCCDPVSIGWLAVAGRCQLTWIVVIQCLLDGLQWLGDAS